MVDNQLRPNEVTDLAVLDAFDTVPREAFVPGGDSTLAYSDHVIDLGNGRAMLGTMALGRMIQQAAIQRTDKVLIVGANTGYGAAIVARLAGAVIALEDDAGLGAQAAAALSRSGTAGVTWVASSLAGGHAAAAPYNVILIEGGCDELPPALGAQLADGGRLLGAQGRGGAGSMILWTKSGGTLAARKLFNCAASVLPGMARAPSFAF